MANTDTRADDLLNSIVGCAFVVALDESGLTPDDVADPKAALLMAAACNDEVFRFRSDYDLVAPGVLALARDKAAQARAVRGARAYCPVDAAVALGRGSVGVRRPFQELGFYEEALNAGLMPGLGDGTLRARFDVSGVEALRETENDKAKRRIGYVKAGIMTAEEVREEMGLRS